MRLQLRGKKTKNILSLVILNANTKWCLMKLTQQHALTVIWMVFRPGWQTRFKYNGRCELLFSPRSITSGVAFAETCTLAGQFVFIWRSSWWKHFNCTSRSDLTMEMHQNVTTNHFIVVGNILNKQSAWKRRIDYLHRSFYRSKCLQY